MNEKGSDRKQDVFLGQKRSLSLEDAAGIDTASKTFQIRKPNINYVILRIAFSFK